MIDISRPRTLWPGVCLLALVLLSSASGFQARLRAEQTGAPAVPTNLTANVTGSTVALAWQAGSGGGTPLAYQLEAGSGPGLANIVVTTIPATSVVATSVPAGIYYLRVRGLNAAGASAPTADIVVFVGCGGGGVVPPTNFAAQVVGQTVTLRWDAMPNALGYQFEAGTSFGATDLGAILLPTTQIGGAVPDGVYYTRVRTLTPCGLSTPTADRIVTVPEPPQPPPVWGVADPAILGTCTAATHDRYVVDGGDGWRYRTWHPQTVPVDSGGTCTFAHEHGDNPQRMTNAEIAASPVRFGYVGRRMAHEEPHEGFKVFIALPGDQNDEFRINRVFSRSVFHMGTGGPRRFDTQHHSAEIRLVHPEFGLKAFTQLMMDTGGVATVCNPRVAAPTKDVVQLQSPCILDSFYEIWSTTGTVKFQGRTVYRAFATPAVFDPITVRNPANGTEVVYAWDTRLNPSLRYPTTDRSRFRGCDRESYAQPGYWYNATGGRTRFYTDAMGNEVPAADPSALEQVISSHNSVGVPATNDGLVQFKRRVNYCGSLRALGLKN